MREILFRGKQKDTGEWVQGDLHHNDDTRFPMTLIGHVVMSRDKYIQQDLNFDGYDLCEVDPETVGQFTGLTDKDGTKVFEGDIIRVNTDGQNILGWVSFERSGFHFRFGKHGTALLTEWAKPLKVIGNVHDTPELTKEATQ